MKTFLQEAMLASESTGFFEWMRDEMDPELPLPQNYEVELAELLTGKLRVIPRGIEHEFVWNKCMHAQQEYVLQYSKYYIVVHSTT